MMVGEKSDQAPSIVDRDDDDSTRNDRQGDVVCAQLKLKLKRDNVI